MNVGGSVLDGECGGGRQHWMDGDSHNKGMVESGKGGH